MALTDCYEQRSTGTFPTSLHDWKIISENVNDPSKTLKNTKKFMNWESIGTPSQLEENGTLITSAAKVAEAMNNFFVNKVKLIRENMVQSATNLYQCMKVMEHKRCKLHMKQCKLRIK